MPTGPKHRRFTYVEDDGGQGGYAEDCRCMIGEDHDEDDTGESLDVRAAADIWRSHGEDEDYTFGFTEAELRRAADMQ